MPHPWSRPRGLTSGLERRLRSIRRRASPVSAQRPISGPGAAGIPMRPRALANSRIDRILLVIGAVFTPSRKLATNRPRPRSSIRQRQPPRPKTPVKQVSEEYTQVLYTHFDTIEAAGPEFAAFAACCGVKHHSLGLPAYRIPRAHRTAAPQPPQISGTNGKTRGNLRLFACGVLRAKCPILRPILPSNLHSDRGFGLTTFLGFR